MECRLPIDIAISYPHMCSHTYNYMYINNLKVKSVDKHEKEKQKWHLYKIKQNDY